MPSPGHARHPDPARRGTARRDRNGPRPGSPGAPSRRPRRSPGTTAPHPPGQASPTIGRHPTAIWPHTQRAADAAPRDRPVARRIGPGYGPGNREVHCVVVMVVVSCIAGLACGIAVVWYVVTRGSRAALVSETEFDADYDERVARGEADESGREAAWRDFDAWQATNDRDRLRWEEAGEE